MSAHHLNGFAAEIENQNWEKYDVLSPVVTTGIPTCELFLDYYMDSMNAEAIRTEFSSISFQDWWDGEVEYSSLNGVYDKLNWIKFLNKVSNLPHKYKGIHPVRVSPEAQILINRWILANRSWRESSPSREVIMMPSSPYFCNSIFACSPILLLTLVKLVKNNAITFDGFDELALNDLLNQRNRKIGFVISALAIHPSYNSIGIDFEEISNEFFSNIEK
jgi:hypothetical protein